MKELLELLIDNIHGFEKSMKFRKGQRPFYDAIAKSLENGDTTSYVEGPTGMGKTFIEAVVAAAMIGDSDMRALLLTSKITLLEQIQKEFKKFVGFLKTGLFGGGFKNRSEQVTIMTYDSFRNLPEHIAKQYQVVLLDEGHKGLGEKTRAKLELQKAFSVMIGFTASATYSEKKSLQEFLVNKAYSLSIVEAVELGMLCNIQVMVANVDIEISGRAKGEGIKAYEDRISSDIIREGGNIAAARLYKRLFAKRNLRFIMLVLTTKQGRDLVNELANEGVKSELIHSGLTKDERNDMFKRFRNNEFQVLVGMGIIKEGFDDDQVSGALITYPIQSLVDITQFPGRALRLDELNPNKVAYIINMAFKGKKQLFYSELLEGKVVVKSKEAKTDDLDIISREEVSAAVDENPKSYITNVAVEHEDVMEVVRSYDAVEFLSYEDLKKAVQATGIKTTLEYMTDQKEYRDWPAVPWEMYKDQYSHKDFFGDRFLSYKDLKKEVQDAGIKTTAEYSRIQKAHDDWPRVPWEMYKDQYSFKDFFGFEKKSLLSYGKLKKAIRIAGVKNRREYKEILEEHDDWPSVPWTMYKDQYSLEDFFGGRYLSYKDLKKEVQDAGIKNTLEYIAARREHSGWPSRPAIKYKDQYSFDDFFGDRFLPYEDLKKEVQDAGIKTTTEYDEVQKGHDDWPAVPIRIYKDQYSHKDFFGDRFLSYEDLKKEVQDAGIKTTAEYSRIQKAHDDWPSVPSIIYKKHYSRDDFFGEIK